MNEHRLSRIMHLSLERYVGHLDDVHHNNNNKRSPHVLGDESLVVNLPDEQAIVLVVTYIKVEYLPTRVTLPALTSKTILATFGYFSIETYVIAFLKARGPLGPLF